MGNQVLLALVALIFVGVFAAPGVLKPEPGISLADFVKREYNYTDPNSLRNHTNEKLRQGSAIALFCTDANLGGTCNPMYATDVDWPTWVEMGALWKQLSSFVIYDINYVFAIWTGQTYTGTEWVFRAPNTVNLSDYGFNDVAQSITATNYAGYTGAAVTLYEDATFKGKSIYVLANTAAGVYSNIATAGFFGTGNFGNDKLSSMYIFPYTSVTLFQNTGQTGTSLGPIVSGAGNYPYSPMPSGYNDWASSLRVIPA